MAKKNAIVLSSGGLNSAVLAAVAAAEHDLSLLHVRFGHRAAEREAELFDKQAEHFQAAHRLVVEMPHFAEIGGSSRINRKKQIEDVLAMNDAESKTYIPGLIASLTAAAFNWATQLGASSIFLGASECLGPPGPRTAGVFPDYSRDFMHVLQQSWIVAYPYRRITLETPLLELSRADIIRLGKRLKAPFELTWSCISSGSKPCGGCIGCATRNRGFLDAGIADPLLLHPNQTKLNTPHSHREPARA